MIRTIPGSRHYGWWQFRWTEKSSWRTLSVGRRIVEDIRRHVRQETDPIKYIGELKGQYKQYPTLATMLTLAFGAHVINQSPTSVHPILWSQSKTGEVNITEFKDKFKEAIARFLAGAVEGGEVVKIDDVTSTSVMVNACCDVTVTRRILTPYACVGLGYNVMVAGDSALVAKPAYKVKLGVGVQVARNVTAHLGGYYHQVISGIKDMELSVFRLIDDNSPDGRTKDAATASFNVAYSGCELGLSFAF